LEIFNFFRKIVSNLQNKRSGNSVILGEQYTVTAPPLASFLRPSRRARGHPRLCAGTRCTLRVVPARSWPRYKAPTTLSAFLPLLCFPMPPPQLRLNSDELPSPPQRKIAPKKQCSSSACSLRIRSTCCYCLISPGTAASDSSSSQSATRPKLQFTVASIIR